MIHLEKCGGNRNDRTMKHMGSREVYVVLILDCEETRESQ
jgi:hypothetical protein